EGTHQHKASVVRASPCVRKRRVGMRRSGALTLGAVLMLGGVTGGRGEDLSGAVGAASTGANFPSLGGFVLPSLPENWSDAPFKLTATEAIEYNSNIFAVANGFVLPAGDVRGDWLSTTTFGASTLAYWYGQQFFFNGSLGEIRYLHQVDFNSDTYSVNAGVNWTYTSRCA